MKELTYRGVRDSLSHLALKSPTKSEHSAPVGGFPQSDESRYHKKPTPKKQKLSASDAEYGGYFGTPLEWLSGCTQPKPATVFSPRPASIPKLPPALKPTVQQSVRATTPAPVEKPAKGKFSV
ncbi:hypothetical protein FRC09_009339 [Ceratobasidium sp. 395]|nr:hypothetical protein FRC09_009339 [Ceratobasidium sp. 395]